MNSASVAWLDKHPHFPGSRTHSFTMNWESGMLKLGTLISIRLSTTAMGDAWYDFGRSGSARWIGGTHYGHRHGFWIEVLRINPNTQRNNVFFTMSTTWNSNSNVAQCTQWQFSICRMAWTISSVRMAMGSPDRSDIPHQATGRYALQLIRKIITSKIDFQGVHSENIVIIPTEKGDKMDPKLLYSWKVHQLRKFLGKLVKGEKKQDHQFEIAGPLSQVFWFVGVMHSRWDQLNLSGNSQITIPRR